MKFNGLIICVLNEKDNIRMFKKKSQNPATLEKYLEYIEQLKLQYNTKLVKSYVVNLDNSGEYIWSSMIWRNNLNNKISPNHQKYLDFLKEHRQDLTFIGPYRSKQSKDAHLCKYGHEWIVAPKKVMIGEKCPFCNRKSYESNGAKFITSLLAAHNIEFMKEVNLKRFSPVHDLRMDFLICKNNHPLFVIEYHGIQHYKNVSPKYFGGPKGLKERKQRDSLKMEVCHKHGLPLIEIPYNYSNEEIEEEVLRYLELYELLSN